MQAPQPESSSVLRPVALTTLKLWPLLVFLFCAKLYLNLTDEEPFSWTADVLLALSSPALLAAFFFCALFLTLKIGIAVKRRRL